MKTKIINSVYEFFDEVLSGELGRLDIDNYIQTLTDNYNLDKLNKLLYDFEYCLFVDEEERIGKFSKTDIELAIKELKKQGKEIPGCFSNIPSEFSHIRPDLFQDNSPVFIIDYEKLLYPYEYFLVKGTINQIKKRIDEKRKELVTEPEPGNIDAQNSMQKVLLLIEFGLIDYLTREQNLPDTQAFKILGTLTNIDWKLIQRYVNGYKNGKEYPDRPNNNNPLTENNRTWLLNLLNQYKINKTLVS